MSETMRYLVRAWYVKPKRTFKNSHLRDILDQLLDIAPCKRSEPAAIPVAIDQTCMARFADLRANRRKRATPQPRAPHSGGTHVRITHSAAQPDQDFDRRR